MRVPTIHLNGTSQESLMEALEQASGKVQEAIDALSEVAPNGRDYYPQGESAINEAVDEHRSRVKRMQAVFDELIEIWTAIDAVPRRKRY